VSTYGKAHRPDPWDRMDQETDPAWQAFVAYRDMGLERSLSKLSRDIHKNKTMLGGWSRKHSWQVRCNAWDREQDRQWQRELANARRAAARRNIRTAGAAMTIAGGALTHLAADPSKLKPQDIARLMEVAAKLESLAMGSPTEIVAGTPGTGAGASQAHIGHLSDEDRRARMLQLRRELDTRLDDNPELDDHEEAS
jgi:hypothetical protein